MRIVVWAAGDGVDVALPGDIPVGALLPAVHDLLADLGLQIRAGEKLVRPGRGPVDQSLSLQDNGIRDGDLLTWTPPEQMTPAPTLVRGAVDAAVTVAECGPPQLTGTVDLRRVCAGFGVVMAALVGAVVVPGPMGVPDVLLAAAAGALMSVMLSRFLGPTAAVVSTSLCSLCAAAALGGTLAGLDLSDTGILLATLSLALLASSARLAVRFCGLTVSAGTELTGRAETAHRMAGALVAGSAMGAASGALVSMGPGSSWAVCGWGGALGALLLLRTRAYPAKLPAASLSI
ncbi:MAG: hypothetical protein K0R68_2399, partial [Mycobacterium sp.]|nr:hypothetical protein [Mycobacterium sp.]